ncbi:aromatic acid exporter family protein [Aliibacillus thermotolerans]|uniref:Aromatic acid exporter family protein n=1 Tax=Aliibacillus thermotolerans TaxID=1834418 RepID=A0ABW0U333_9BACI|nr:aromatic acid exporter family protein [Aliibacillus thermotolerans]MDA3129901.1 aromatic acid exporter family protein [Aliibacillus thermotolerans]
MKLGARIFKTGLAIILSIYTARWLGLEPTLYAALSATFAIQPSIFKTYQTILEQIQANMIGATIAVIFGLTLGHNPVIIGVAVMVAIAIILKLKLETSAISLAIVTIIIIMGNPQDGFILFALERFSLIMLGVFSAFVVNLVFLPPKHENNLYYKMTDLTDEVIRWIRLITSHDYDIQSFKKDLSHMNEALVKLDNYFLLYKEERNYFPKTKLGKARKLVIYKQMIVTLKKAFMILKMLDRHDNEVQSMPDRMKKLIRHQLEHLTDYHERILLRYIGKVNLQITDEMAEEVDEGRESLTDLFMDLYDHNEIDREQWLRILPVVSHIVEYNDELEHLDLLLESFFRYHQSDEPVNIEERV